MAKMTGRTERAPKDLRIRLCNLNGEKDMGSNRPNIGIKQKILKNIAGIYVENHVDNVDNST